MSRRRSPIEERIRRHHRIRSLRGWLHFGSGFGFVAAVMLVIRGPWIGAAVVLVVIGLAQLARLVLGRRLPPPPEPIYWRRPDDA